MLLSDCGVSLGIGAERFEGMLRTSFSGEASLSGEARPAMQLVLAQDSSSVNRLQNNNSCSTQQPTDHIMPQRTVFEHKHTHTHTHTRTRFTCLLLAKVTGHQGYRALGVGPGEANWKWPIVSCHTCAPPRQRDAGMAYLAGILCGKEGGKGGGGGRRSLHTLFLIYASVCKSILVGIFKFVTSNLKGNRPSALH